MRLELPKETRERMLASIKQFAEEELDLEMGDLKASLVYDFFLKELAPSVYNAAILDAQKHMSDRVEELSVNVAQAEFGYWRR